MIDQNEFQRYLEGSASENGRVFIEVPPPMPPQIEKMPAGYTPMERIGLEGHAYRGLASGHIPWWVIVAGWVMLGVPCLMITILVATSGDLLLLGSLAFPMLFGWILWRGTAAKVAGERSRAQRMARRKQDMQD